MLWLLCLACLACLVGDAPPSARPFVVRADSPQIAARIEQHAHACRDELTRLWFGEPPRPWPYTCRIEATVHDGPMSGRTVAYRRRGEVLDQSIEVEGSLEAILRSAIPHEVTHAVWNDHLAGEIPLWAHEGAACLAEHPDELVYLDRRAAQMVADGSSRPLEELFRLQRYPTDRDEVLAFYAQSYSVTRFLVAAGGHQRFVRFVQDGRNNAWNEAAVRHYGRSLEDLQRLWRQLVLRNQGYRQSDSTATSSINAASIVAQRLSWIHKVAQN